MLDNGENVPSRQCYCLNGDCGPSGTLNISSCKFGAPAFVSMPHFYLADPSYVEAVTGLSPNKDKHELSVVLEPVSSRVCLELVPVILYIVEKSPKHFLEICSFMRS